MIEENPRAGVLDVASGRHQRDPTGLGDTEQAKNCGARRWSGELGEIAGGELGELGGVVPVPPTQLGARRNVRGPLVERRRLLGDASRPEAVDEDAVAAGVPAAS